MSADLLILYENIVMAHIIITMFYPLVIGIDIFHYRSPKGPKWLG